MGFVKSDDAGDKDATATAPSHDANRIFRLAHLSDLHLFEPQNMAARDFLSKRVLGYLSWRLHRQSQHRNDFMPALHRALSAVDLDHTVVTGDLTHLGHAADVEAAAQILQQLGGPERLTLIPGNHDAYVGMPWADGLFSLSAYLASDPISRDGAGPAPAAPSLRVRGNMAIVGVSSACPTPPLMATGTIGPKQLGRLNQVLVQTASQGLFRLLLVHHPPVPGQIARRKRLTDQPAFADIIAQSGAELILHGHAHRFREATIDGPSGKIPVIGVPSLTALSGRSQRRAGFCLYRIAPAAAGWQVEMTVFRYSISQAAFVTSESRRLPIPPPPPRRPRLGANTRRAHSA